MIIGVAGCGRMGMGMARALDQAGFAVRGYDVVEKDAPFMVPLATFRADITVLISVVRDVAQTEDVLFGAQRLCDAPGLRTIILSSTLSPRYVTALRARVPDHIALIDAPMSGAQIAADEARLSFMLGGAEGELDAMQPLFDAMGRVSHRMGGFGAGATAKVLNNLVAASSTAATRTALAWADALGLDEGRLRALMHDSTGQTWFGTHYDDIEFARDGYAPDNTIGILVKDVQAAMDGAPDGADLTLAKAIQASIRALPPRPKRG
ncbi:3-hydroxyisobutyrate dehydrogenase-like beta-hydroxyacid dehydrogenase [Rubricella aquisinus]|uniref:3-hydroxyisobutyrate dehydrogenase-like beta-hydroxyacid dehydrogenase n=1 Tax=Rubricella aquisinus TaxID=2028108 RepID=A0A840WPD9_9RHOB|nr:NAD(P)-binding domain-containing protein [Rubricella aquisinus]MBB5515943.1 3-hydroxyisobutyrate dehydrogenase-like beta-hydroxyacid dehydrogenase [Rubricella aquisinus]